MTNEGASVAAPPPASAPLVPSNICMHHNLCHCSEKDKTQTWQNVMYNIRVHPVHAI